MGCVTQAEHNAKVNMNTNTWIATGHFNRESRYEPNRATGRGGGGTSEILVVFWSMARGGNF